MRTAWILLGIAVGVLLTLLFIQTAPAQEPVFDPGAWGVTFGPKGRTAIMWNTEIGAAYRHDVRGGKPEWTRMLFLKWSTSGDADPPPTEEIR